MTDYSKQWVRCALLVRPALFALALAFTTAKVQSIEIYGDYKLQGDLAEPIKVMASGVTVDGAGHSIVASAPFTMDCAVSIVGRNDVAIKNFRNLEGQRVGVHLQDCENIRIQNTTFTLPGFCGVEVAGQAKNIVISGNTFIQGAYGVYLQDAWRHPTTMTISENTFRYGRRAIDVPVWQQADVSGVVFRDNRLLHQSQDL